MMVFYLEIMKEPSMVGQLYYLKLYSLVIGENDTVNYSHKNSIRSSILEDWHRILGHVNRSDMLKLETVVDDMKILSKKEDFSCDRCILSKQVVNRDREPDDRATASLIFSDLAGQRWFQICYKFAPYGKVYQATPM